MKGTLEGSVFVLFIVAFGVYAVLTFWMGWSGIEDRFGSGWAWAAVVVAFLGFTLPVYAGVFLFAIDTWQWHWFFALLLACPGLALMIPQVFLGILGPIRRRLGR